MRSARLSDVWDDAAALGFCYGHLLPVSVAARGRELVERLAPRSPGPSDLGSAPRLRYFGRDTLAARAIAAELHVGPPDERAADRAPTAPDLEVHEVVRRSSAKWRARGFLIAPQFVVGSVDLEVPERSLWDRKRRQRAQRVTRDLPVRRLDGGEWTRRLHQEMYVPLMRARFGSRAYVARHRFHARIAREGHVLAVGEPPAIEAVALVVRVRGRAYTHDVRAFGARPEPRPSPRVWEALFVSAIRAARARGERRLGLGACYPFIRSGTLRFKKRWGAEFAAEQHDPRCFAVRPTSPAGLREILDVGLIHEDRSGRLRALGGAAQPATPGVEALDQPADLAAFRALARRLEHGP